MDRLRRQEDSLAIREDNLKYREAALIEDKAFVRSQFEAIDRQRLKDREALDRDRDTIETTRKQFEERFERLTVDNTTMQHQLKRLQHELDFLRQKKNIIVDTDFYWVLTIWMHLNKYCLFPRIFSCSFFFSTPCCLSCLTLAASQRSPSSS